MRLEGHQKRLTIFVGESDHHGHTPLAIEIVIIDEVEVVKYVGRARP